MELTAAETLEETQASKLVARALGNNLDNDSDTDLDDIDGSNDHAPTNEDIESFIAQLKNLIVTAPMISSYHEKLLVRLLPVQTFEIFIVICCQQTSWAYPSATKGEESLMEARSHPTFPALV
jgi:hypothetical protein